MRALKTISLLSYAAAVAYGCSSSGRGNSGPAAAADAGTDTGTETVTATNTATSTSVTTTVTATSTSTLTGTNTVVQLSLPDGSACDGHTDPHAASAGGVFRSTNGTWHAIAGDGAEWVVNMDVYADGGATGCGSLLTEITNSTAPSKALWKGISTTNCIWWGPTEIEMVAKGAPVIQGTGIAVKANKIALAGTNINAWSDERRTIAACQ